MGIGERQIAAATAIYAKIHSVDDIAPKRKAPGTSSDLAALGHLPQRGRLLGDVSLPSPLGKVAASLDADG